MAEINPRTSFRFALSVSGLDGDLTFQEVAGLEPETHVEELAESGQNRLAHTVPRPNGSRRLTFKRAVAGNKDAFIDWCRTTLESGLSAAIVTRNLQISLLDDRSVTVARWSVADAWPVSWQVGAFDAMKNELALDNVELAYQSVTREL